MGYLSHQLLLVCESPSILLLGANVLAPISNSAFSDTQR